MRAYSGTIPYFPRLAPSRRRAGRGVLSGVLCPVLLLVLLPVCAVCGAPSTQADLERRSAELGELESRTVEVRSELNNKQRQLDAVSESLREIETGISETGAELRNLEMQAQSAAEQTARLTTKATVVEKELVVERSKLGVQLQAAYRFAPAAPLRILLDSKSVATSRRMVAYLGYLHRSRARRIAEVVSLSEEIQSLKRDAAEEQERIDSLLLARRESVREIERARDRRQRTAESLRIGISEQKQELDQLVENRKKLEALVAALQRDLDAPRPSPRGDFVNRRGSLAWPVEGELNARFGDPRPRGGPSWSGVLIAAPMGREVKAVHAGTVVFAEWLRGFGLTLIIDHGDGYLTVYSHNDAIYRKLGESVNEGEVVAEVGRSGGVDSDALYFEIRHRGKALNPSRWLARR